MHRRTIVAGLLWCMGSAAHAQWSYLGPTQGGDVYVALASRSKADGHGRLRLLANLDQPRTERDGSTYRSSVAIQEFDCPGRRVRQGERHTFGDLFAKGTSRPTPLHDEPWKAVPAGSRADGLLRLACDETPLLDLPTRDWLKQPLVPGSQTLRYDPSHTLRDGDRLSLRWLMEEPPANVRPPAGYAAKSTEAEMTIDCSKGLILSTTGLGRASTQGQGTAVVIATVLTEVPLDNGLPEGLAALARQLCSSGRT